MRSRITAQTLEAFWLTLAHLLAAHVPLSSALELICAQHPHRRFKRLIETIMTDLRHGMLFTESLKKYPQYFEPYERALLVMAEHTGTYTAPLETIAELRSWQWRQKQTAKQALIYPAFLALFLLIFLAVVQWLMIPALKESLPALFDKGVPYATQILLNISDRLNQPFFITSCGLILLLPVLGWIARAHIPLFMHRLSYYWPGVGSLRRQLDNNRFTRIFATLLAHKLDMLTAYYQASQVVKNPWKRSLWQRYESGLIAGERLSDIFAKVLSPHHRLVHFVRLGENSGELPTLLLKEVAFHEQEIVFQTQRILAMIQPVILALLGLCFLFLTYALFVPLYTLGAGGGV